jgi:hypothetical protein
MEYLTPEDYEIASQNGIGLVHVQNRFYKLYWDRTRAITEPVQPKIVSPEWQRNKERCLQNGISNKVFMARIKIGWSEEEASTQPVLSRAEQSRRIAQNRRDKLSPYVSVAEANGISRQTWYARVKRGMSEEEAATMPVREYVKSTKQ